ncbi:MAG: hypothetical protein OXL37_06410 [Chloroflexota bacterium]|nr:hypothetical protein [Chloroflexota bacterium]MDE2959889.1 hypothetical protein [Chloroflexota bacterium]
MLPGLPDAKRVFPTTVRILAAAGALALAAAACQPAPPDNRTIPPLTPPAAVSEPTATVPANATGPPLAGSVATLASPSVSSDVVARTDQRMEALSARMVRPRQVDADVLWAVLIMSRVFGIGSGSPPDLEAPAKMLEMWHSGNACYAMLEKNLERLGTDNHLTPVDFNAFVAHVEGRLSACLDEQWPKVDAEQFFANPHALRDTRVTTWIDVIWEFSNFEALTDLEQCHDGFYAHLPDVASAGDAHALEAAWAAAMVDFSACRQESIRSELPFMELNETRMFAFELSDRYTLIALQTTVGGHLVAISMQRPYEECWPDFEASVPGVALATGPAQLVESRDAALRALRACIEALPEHDPFPRAELRGFLPQAPSDQGSGK